MSMTTREKEMIESLRTNLEKSERERQHEQAEHKLYKRMYETVADLFNLSDVDRDNIRLQSQPEDENKWIPLCSR